MLSEAEIRELRAGTWRAHCPKMTVRKSTNEGTTAYEGGGFIERTPDGRLSFTFYSPAERAEADLFRSHGSLGQLIAEDEYYNLTATDIRGRCWESKRILPNTDSWADSAGIAIDGPLDSVSCTTSFGISPVQCEVDLRFFDDIEIPGNTITEVTTTVGGELQSRRSRWDATRFMACGCRFEIRSQEGVVRVLASAAEELPPNLALRVSDALQFVLALPLQWGLLSRRERAQTGVQIRSVRDRHGRCKLGPPIAFRDPACSQYIWQLFEKYLSYILPYEKPDKRDPISTLVRQALNGSEGSIDAQALTLAVAVEGVLKRAFRDLERLPTEQIARLKHAKSLIGKLGIDPSLKHQIRSTLGGWKKARARDMLDHLVDMNVITEQERDAWKTLRNPSAHASLPCVGDYQKLVDLCSLTLMLFYKLIYRAIGYNGPYVDYGKPGWPLVGR